jgi:hypothetical protein
MRDLLQRYFDDLCSQTRLRMSAAERADLARERTRVATILAFWRD